MTTESRGAGVAGNQGAEGLSVRVLRDGTEWDRIRTEWDALYAASPHVTPPLDFAWLRRWWHYYGPDYGGGGLRVVCVWRQDRLVGTLPVYISSGRGGGPIRSRVLRFVSTGESTAEETCPEFLDLLCRPEDEQAVAPVAWEALRRLDWDTCEFADVAGDTALLRRWPGWLTLSVIPRGTSYVADLSGGFAAYMAGPSSSHLRRTLRQGEKAGARFDVADEDTADEIFEDLVRLHEARWKNEGKSGVFSAPRFLAFHRDLVRDWVPKGRAILARVSFGSDVLAVQYGFVTGTRFDLYQSGVRMRECEEIRSPGILAILWQMEWLACRGVTTYDFLRGPATHKERMSTSKPPMVSLQGFRHTPRGLAARALAFAARVRRERRAHDQADQADEA